MGLGSLVGGLVGGAGGFLLGGPAGAAAGYGLGSSLGNSAQTTIDPGSDPANQQNAQNAAQYNAKMALAQQQQKAAADAYNAKAPLRQAGLGALAQFAAGQGSHRGIFGVNTPIAASAAPPPSLPIQVHAPAGSPGQGAYGTASADQTARTSGNPAIAALARPTQMSGGQGPDSNQGNAAANYAANTSGTLYGTGLGLNNGYTTQSQDAIDAAKKNLGMLAPGASDAARGKAKVQ